jgi:hypothetical protein
MLRLRYVLYILQTTEIDGEELADHPAVAVIIISLMIVSLICIKSYTQIGAY